MSRMQLLEGGDHTAFLAAPGLATREDGHPTEKTRLGLEKRFGSGLTKARRFSRTNP